MDKQRLKQVLWVLMNVSNTHEEIFEIMQAVGGEKAGMELWREYNAEGDYRNRALAELKELLN